jgi:MFS family permease
MSVAPLHQYLHLIKSHGRFLAFGFLMAFTSSAGQTYFIGIFGPEIREVFHLNHTQWGSIYLVGTLCSALVLPWSGNLIDRISLNIFTVIVITGLAIACLTISFSSSVVMLTVAIFLLRHFGQGLASHTSITSMARYMSNNRGKSIAIASMGYSTGEAILPVLAVSAIVVLGWRNTYLVAAVCVIGILPIVLYTLRGHSFRHKAFIADHAKDLENNKSGILSKTRSQMLKEGRFYLLLPAILAPSYIGTGLFFHHLTLAEEKQWSALWVTGNYGVYAVFTVITSLVAGPIIDRFTAAKVLPYYLVPLVLALLILIPASNPYWVIPYMILIGVNTGIHFTGVSALWAEIYGPRYLGGIKSTVGAIGVLASALGPVSIGVILDMGYTFDTVCLYFSAISIISTFLLILGLKKFQT